MYAAITGIMPPGATERSLHDAVLGSIKDQGVKVPEQVEKAILHGLEVQREDRPQSMGELYAEMYGAEPDPGPDDPNELIYQTGMKLMAADTPEGYKKALVQFELIPGWKNAGDMAEICRKKIQGDARSIKTKESAETPNPKPRIWLIIPVLAVLAAAGFFLYRGIHRNQLNSAGAQTAIAGTITQSALELAVQQTSDGENTQSAQAGMTEQAAAAGTQTARQTQTALSAEQTGTAWNLTAAAELQQTQTQAALEANATQAEQESQQTATSWFMTQEAQLHQTETRAAEETLEARAFFDMQTATQSVMESMQTETASAERTAEYEQTAGALEQTQAAFHVMETEMAFVETQIALDLRRTAAAATKTKSAEPTATPTPEATATATKTLTPTVTNTSEPTATPTKEPLRVGDNITFGQYEQDGDLTNGAEAIEWQVLAVEDGRALVISKYGLDAKPYNEKEVSVTWETCTLRAWLNGEFYNSAFSSEEKLWIRQVTVKNSDNPTWGTKGGNDTTDRIFLLSIEEAERYFANDEARKCRPTTYAKNNGLNVYEKTGIAWWWLRSPGIIDSVAASVGTSGYVGTHGNYVYSSDTAARPAFWLDLEEAGNSVVVFRDTETPVPTNTPAPTATLEIIDENEYYRVITDTFLRNTPSSNGAVVRSVLQGSILTSTGERREAEGKTWLAVKTENLQEGWVELAKTEKIDDGLRVGNFIFFGQYEQDGDLTNGAEAIEWQVLMVEEDRALVISRYGLDAKPYYEKLTSVTWETSTLRAWLNGEFYNSAFSSDEKGRIRQVTLKNPDNPSDGTKGGNDTTDRIFLLSIEEAEQYFADDEARKCRSTMYAIKNGAYLSKSDGGTTWWWLRSPGRIDDYAARVFTAGNVNSHGSTVDNTSGSARPAFWLNL